MKVAMVCYHYGIETSPTLKNICSYLFDEGFGPIDVYLDELYVDKSFTCRTMNIKRNVVTEHFLSFFLPSTRSRKLSEHLFIRRLKKHIETYELVFAVDYRSLAILAAVDCDLSRVVFISLEGVDHFRNYESQDVYDNLSRCRLCMVQSKERGEDISTYLKNEIDFVYLPVSQRPCGNLIKNLDGQLKIIYSGYFAEWACLLELLKVYRDSQSSKLSSLLLQGHFPGTQSYLAQVQYLAKGISNVSVDASYHDEASYSALLAQNHAGIAFYRNISGSSNFDNLILSSGKIATYLWSGLAIMTNILCEQTQVPPFVYVDIDGDSDSFRKAVAHIASNREVFNKAAFDLAQNRYNFDTYFEKIMEIII